MRDRFGALVRGDTSRREIALVFTADEFMDGAQFILNTLREHGVPGSFFLTGNSFEQEGADSIVTRIVNEGHYLGPHSDAHLLYCDWGNRDSLLVTQALFDADLKANYERMRPWGVDRANAPYFIPPYEWYNQQVVAWTEGLGLELVNFTPGLRTPADYTYPEMGSRYWDSQRIYQSVLAHEQASPSGLNGYVILVHLGTDSRRTDKFYYKLPMLLEEMKAKSYSFERIDKLIN